MLNNNKKMIGCSLSSNMGDNNGDVFRKEIWKDFGFSDMLSILKNTDYGKDISLILLQFYINPIQYELDNLNDIEDYRKAEKSLALPIIITNNNYFSKNNGEASVFLKEEILNKLRLLKEFVKRKKLDTNIELLIKDVKNILK